VLAEFTSTVPLPERNDNNAHGAEARAAAERLPAGLGPEVKVDLGVDARLVETDTEGGSLHLPEPNGSPGHLTPGGGGAARRAVEHASASKLSKTANSWSGCCAGRWRRRWRPATGYPQAHCTTAR